MLNNYVRYFSIIFLFATSLFAIEGEKQYNPNDLILKRFDGDVMGYFMHKNNGDKDWLFSYDQSHEAYLKDLIAAAKKDLKQITINWSGIIQFGMTHEMDGVKHKTTYRMLAIGLDPQNRVYIAKDIQP